MSKQKIVYKGNIIEQAKRSAALESRQEVGIEPIDINYFSTSKCGAKFTWDMFYFVVTDYEQLEGQELEVLTHTGG